MKHYTIQTIPVTPRVVMKPEPYTANVITYLGIEYDIIWDNNNNGWIIVDGKKRYLEEI